MAPALEMYELGSSIGANFSLHIRAGDAQGKAHSHASCVYPDKATTRPGVI